jgi:hypothetical protein
MNARNDLDLTCDCTDIAKTATIDTNLVAKYALAN